MRNKVLATIAFLLSATVYLQASINRPDSYAIGGAYCHMLNTEGRSDMLISRNGHPNYSFQIGYNTYPTDTKAAFAERLNYPVIGIGLTYDQCSAMKFKNNSRLGDFLNIYTFLEGSFYKNRYFSAGYWMNIGLGITGETYDPITNPYQYYVGAPLSIYISCGPQIKFRPSDNMELALNAYWYHHSNGNMWMSNIGLNGLAGGASLRYYVNQPYTKQVRSVRPADFRKGFIFDVYGAYGLHACKTEFLANNQLVRDPEKKQASFKSRPRIGIGFDVLYRYSLMLASGVVAELNYNWDGPMLKRSDTIIYGEEAVRKGPGYSPMNVGLAFQQELYYGDLVAFCGVGAFLFRRVGINENFSRCYQRIGMRYLFTNWNNMFAGWCIRATKFNDADYFEFQIGMRF